MATLPEAIELQIVTPERHVLQETVQSVEIPGKEGYLGILPGHAPLITELGVGILGYRKGSESKFVTVIHGYAEVLPDRVIIPTCAPGVRPNSGAKVDVWIRNSWSASGGTRLLNVPKKLFAVIMPLPIWVFCKVWIDVSGMDNPKFALTPSTVKLLASLRWPFTTN